MNTRSSPRTCNAVPLQSALSQIVSPFPVLANTTGEADRFMRRPEVQRVTSLSRSSLYRLIAAGDFPAPIRLSANSVAWLASEVHAWVAQCVERSRNARDTVAFRKGG